MFDQVLDGFFSIQAVVFAVVIWLEVLLLRKLVEVSAKKVAPIFPDKWEPWWVELWREWILPGAPIVLGGLTAGLVTQYPLPEVFANSAAGRVFCGLALGLASGYVYPRVLYYYRKFLPKKVDEQVEQITDAAQDK